MRDTKWSYWVGAAGAFAGLSLGVAAPAMAAGKKRPEAVPAVNEGGKRVLALEPVRDVRIELPDGKFHDFGSDFEGSLRTRLHQSGRYVVADPPARIGSLRSLLTREASPPEFEWPGSDVPAATVKVTVEAMSFQTGSRGDRMFYGFNERFRTAFNNGYDPRPNEFPLRAVSFEPNWFDRSFDARGSAPFDSRSGLDLGEGVGIDAIFAWLSVKYALYRSELRIRLDVDAPLAGRREYREISVQGEGYYFDIAGAYLGYSAGIQVARRDAMNQALRNAIAGAYDAIDRALRTLPLTARVDAITDGGYVLLGTGRGANVRAGVKYEVLDDPSLRIEVLSSSSSGSTARLVQGELARLRPGMLLREAIAGLPPAKVRSSIAALSSSGTVPAAIESIQLPWTDLARADLGGLAPVVSWGTAFLRSLREAIFLPYRLWRYYSYDQAYKSQVHGSSDASSSGWGGDWAGAAARTDWARQIGLDSAPDLPPGKGGSAPVVAVIDSGVDYNHRAIHSRLWLNPIPVARAGRGPSSRRDRYGWDFISGDAHPYDDGYHGTEVASLVTAVAPGALIMPLKVFNPWGITSSAAILGAFRYAVDHGARIIVCGWATRLPSRAIEEGVAYAREHGALVVAAAGDRGDRLSQVAAYPASLARVYDNVLTVTGVTRHDRLVQAKGRFASYDSGLVGLAAPGEKLRAATPRGEETTDTSTGLAAAIVAGAAARLLADEPAQLREQPSAWIRKLRDEADVVPSLADGVAGGLRLRVRH